MKTNCWKRAHRKKKLFKAHNKGYIHYTATEIWIEYYARKLFGWTLNMSAEVFELLSPKQLYKLCDYNPKS